MAEVVAGRYVPRGEGLALWLSRAVTGAPHDEVVTSPMIRGPFVVVACWLRARSEWAHSAELLVMGAPLTTTLGFGEGRAVGGYRLMSAGAHPVRDGSVPLADPAGYTTEGISALQAGSTWFPWYLFDGAAACIGLVVRRHDLAGVLCQWNAGVTVWPLAPVVEVPVARPRRAWPTRRGRLVG